MTASRWIVVLSVALLVSLGANLFLGGIVVGRGVRGQAPLLTEAGMRVGVERMLRTLPDEDRRIVKQMFDEQRPQVKERFEALRAARRTVAQTLQAEPFDKVAFATAYDDVRERSVALQDSLLGIVKEAVPLLSSEGKRALAEGRWARQ
jgi:uncharacterized membrane protein